MSNAIGVMTATLNGRTFATGATRDTDDGKPDYEGYLSPLVIEAYGAYMLRHQKQPDGTMRPSDNWQLGIPKPELMKSLWRHFLSAWKKHRLGADPTDDLCAMLFNAMAYIHALKTHENPAPAVPQERLQP